MPKQEIIDQYLPTIGIECHVQLKTKTKLFSGASNEDRDMAPNTTVSPICFGLPGTLPVLNAKAVELAVRAGTALNAEIALVSSFDRKHYFYPDLPKGYQITQLHQPTILAGCVDVPVGEQTVKVRIHHAHLEEDAGKSTHPSGAEYSLVDLNRAGTPLIEIVSEPDIHSAAEAKAYAQELYLLMKYAGVTHGNLQHGNMRFDVNISVAKKGAKTLGTRAEVKNLNSFRAVERAVMYEIDRQVGLLEKGEKVVQETRGWIDASQKTVSQRTKEEAQDYRYFPEPDLPPVVLTDEEIQTIKADMPKLPPHIRRELERLGLDQSTAETLILQDALGGTHYVATVLAQQSAEAARFAANFMANRDSKRRQDKPGLGLANAKQFASVFALYGNGKLSSNAADDLLFVLADKPGVDAASEAEKAGLLQENDESALGQVVEKVLADPASQQAIADIKAGNQKAIGYLVGQVMKLSQGKANPAKAQEIIRHHL